MITLDEINMLLDGLDALEEGAKKDLALTSIVKGMVGLVEPKDIPAEFDQLKVQRRPQTEAITLLKAKLIVLRDKKEISELDMSELLT